ncbi:cytochrome c family protein [Novosphingobium flavum]|uniref:Cytochrome c family protein n=1 Tax=Novosphingobium aerophilum TaxID=2839843 RepID=A0A7X1F6Q4_9SPHN|nr:cytochrome c family protein [Novosphingobium aerophilum]MBC2661160.1 cytochrome c family protein [Novosphingobium aerophilum]
MIAAMLASATLAMAPAAHAAGDAVKGKAVFAQCAACHKADASGKSTIGPNLWKVVGRPAGTQPGFNYSPAMKGAKRAWTEANLDAYLAAPAKAVPGNRMPFAGLKDATARANVIAYLKTLK